jgi:alpha-D-xyloside xylohydrolase
MSKYTGEALHTDPNFQLGGLLEPSLKDEKFQAIQKVTAWMRRGSTVTFRCRTSGDEEAQVILQACAPDLLRLRLIPREEALKSSPLMLVRETFPPVPLSIRETPDRVVVRTSRLHIQVAKDPWELSIRDGRGKVICRENRSDTNLRGAPRVKFLGFARDASGQVERVHEALFLAPDERLYGFGEKFTPMDKRGQRIDCWNFNTWGTTNERAYKNVPFFMSSKGYGVFVHSSRRSLYELGTAGSSVSTAIEVRDSRLDLFILYGPSLKQVLRRYTDLTGRPPVPPKWSFGLWMSRYGYRTRRELESVGKELRKRDIPCDVLHLDPYWMRENQYADLVWDQQAFPHPAEMIRGLRAKGFRLSLWLQPWIPQTSEVYGEGEAGGYFARRADGSVYLYAPTIPRKPVPCGIVDFSNPGAVQWYQEKIRRLAEMGVAAFKTDFGEAIPEDAHFHNGLTGRDMHNLYPILYNRTFYEVFEALGGDRVVWSRSAFAGSQRYPVHWGGDPFCTFTDLALSLWAGLSMGMSGFPFWSHDIGGFQGRPTPEVYVRWAQCGLLSSHSRSHGTTPREPWEYGDRALQIFRRYAKLRYRLLPYLYTCAHEAAATGTPVMRPMVLEFQNDQLTHRLDLQYMLGPSLLVAPVLDETTKRSVYLPRGTWTDFWSDRTHQGPGVIEYPAPLDVLPLLVRDDSIVPLGPEMSFVGEKQTDPLTLEMYLTARAQCTVKEDDATIHVKAVRLPEVTQIAVAGPERTYLLRLHRTKAPARVMLNNRPLVRRPDKRTCDRNPDGWWRDPQGCVAVKVHGGGALRVRLLD